MTTKYLDEEWDKFQRDLFEMLLKVRRRINWVSIHHQGNGCSEEEAYTSDESLSHIETVDLIKLANKIMEEIIRRNDKESLFDQDEVFEE